MNETWVVYAVCLSIALVASLACSLGLIRAGAFSRFAARHPFESMVVSALFSLAVAWGGTKPPVSDHLWRFQYANGVTDNGSVCSGDSIHAKWSYSAPAMAYTLKAYYQDLSMTNAEGTCTDALHELESVSVALSEYTWTVANATNMRVVCYATYIAPPIVHTNGVYHMNGVMRAIDSETKFVTPAVRIFMRTDSGAIVEITPTNAPPAAQGDSE